MTVAGDPPLRVERDGRVVILQLNRPEARNAFNRGLFEAVAAAVRSASADDDVSVILLTAAGPAFSAGWDTDELRNPDQDVYEGTSAGYRQMMEALESCTLPVVAAVDGAAVGIGFTLLGHCDLVVVGPRARFRAPFAGLGLVPEAGSTALLPRLLGPHLTAELMFTGRWLGPEEALAAGLGTSAARPHKVEESARVLAADVAEQGRHALVLTKQLLVEGRHGDAVRARKEESRLFRALHLAADRRARHGS